MPIAQRAKAQPLAVVFASHYGRRTQTPEDNYRVEAVDSLGPLGSTKILDAPYSIEHSAARPDREFAGHQLQRRIEVPAPGGIPGTAGTGHLAAANPRQCRAAISRTRAWTA